MAKNRLPEIDDDDELNPDVLNDILLKGASNMPSLSSKQTRKDDPGRKRVLKAISLPQYVWDWIKAEHRAQDKPQNAIVLQAMKNGGAPIEEIDLQDARKTRWQK